MTMIGFVWDYWPWFAVGVPLVIGLGVAAYVLRDWRLVVPILGVIGAAFVSGRAYSKGQDTERERLARANDAAKRRRAEQDRKAQAETDEDLRKELRG